MAEYIDRDAAITAMIALNMVDFERYSADIPEGFNQNHLERAIEALKRILAADVIEVVRCKDCTWKQGSECTRFADVRPFPDDFCSRGERRGDD